MTESSRHAAISPGFPDWTSRAPIDRSQQRFGRVAGMIRLRLLIKRLLQGMGLRYSWVGRRQVSVHIVRLPFEPSLLHSVEIEWVPRLNSSAAIAVNGAHAPALGDCVNRVRYAAEHFLPWENIIAIPAASGSRPMAVGVRWNGPPPHGAALEPGHVARTSDGAESQLLSTAVTVAAHDEFVADREALAFILRSIARPGSKYGGLVPGCFDCDQKMFRLHSWIWTNGAIIAALLESLDQGEAAAQRAVDVGRRLLTYQVSHGSNRGAFPVRWDIAEDSPVGVADWYAPNDAAFMASYGFVRLFKAGAGDEFFVAANSVGEWILREALKKDGRLSVGYRADIERWDWGWLYVDAGFTLTLFRDLYAITKEDRWRAAAVAFANWFVARFWHAGGRYFAKTVVRNCRKQVRRWFSRGQAWAIDGMIAAWEASGDDRFLNIASECAVALMHKQTASGAWHYLANEPQSGLCNKGTPVIGYNLARLGNITDNSTMRVAAARAATWCVEAADRSESIVRGAIVARNQEGAFANGLYAATAFPYASAFYLMLRRELNRA
jgi:hypothetical protein